MESVLKKRKNVNTDVNIRNIFKSEKEKKKTILNKLFFQIIICSLILIILFAYKAINPLSFQYNKDKYSWLLKYNMEYSSIYNFCANYLNNNFKFNIPLKENNNLINNSEELNFVNEPAKVQNEMYLEESEVLVDTVIESNENMQSESEETYINEIESYNNMQVMANEIKEKYNLVKPTTGQITCPFGNRQSDNKDISTFHLGIDIGNIKGTKIVAAMDGIVYDVSENSIYGKHIKIKNDDILMVYAHCNKTLVKKGEEIKAGELIAEMGETGLATGVHLHFEVRKEGVVINPEYLIDFK